MRRSVTSRVFAVVWAVLQLALPGVALLADARIVRDSFQSPSAHVESGSTKTCRPAHPDECALCQVVSRAGAPSASPALPAIATVVRPSAALPVSHPVDAERALTALPRAPPSIA